MVAVLVHDPFDTLEPFDGLDPFAVEGSFDAETGIERRRARLEVVTGQSGVLRQPHPAARQPERAARLRPSRSRRAVRRHAPEVYRRRRLVAAGLFLLAVAGVLVAGQAVLARIGGGPLITSGAGGAVRAADQVYVVKPGDTLWSIATFLDPSGDVRPLVAQLAQETGSPTVYPGERIPLP